jgi:hypothetical protein
MINIPFESASPGLLSSVSWKAVAVESPWAFHVDNAERMATCCDGGIFRLACGVVFSRHQSQDLRRAGRPSKTHLWHGVSIQHLEWRRCVECA